MTRALVTGIGGQDGSYLAERLLSDGLEVHGLHHAADGPPRHCPAGVVVHEGDLTDTGAVRRLLAEVAPGEVYNLAAVSSVALSWKQPDLVASVNGTAAVSLMKSALALQDDTGRPVRVVQASSAEIFGRPAISPQDESTPIAPVNPYGDAKAHAHRAAGALREQGLHVVSAILYNHESPRRPPTFVTRKVTSAAVRIAAGTQHGLVLGNLDARRDWGWAPDYVDAMVRAARAEEPQDFVIATGVSHSVRDLVAAAFACVGIDDWAPYVATDPALVRPVEATELVGDPSRARRLLGWRTTMDFTGMIARMVHCDLEGDG